MIVRKKRTREHVIADLGVNYLERMVLLCGHTVEKLFHDYGYDLLLSTYDDNGEPEPGNALFQVKATDSLAFVRGEKEISVRLARADLARWLFEPVPVILVIYDAKADLAYWLYVQRYFQSMRGFNIFSAGQTVTVHIPASNLVERDTAQTFRDFRDKIVGQSIGVIDHNA